MSGLGVDMMELSFNQILNFPLLSLLPSLPLTLPLPLSLLPSVDFLYCDNNSMVCHVPDEFVSSKPCGLDTGSVVLRDFDQDGEISKNKRFYHQMRWIFKLFILSYRFLWCSSWVDKVLVQSSAWTLLRDSSPWTLIRDSSPWF